MDSGLKVDLQLVQVVEVAALMVKVVVVVILAALVEFLSIICREYVHIGSISVFQEFGA